MSFFGPDRSPKEPRGSDGQPAGPQSTPPPAAAEPLRLSNVTSPDGSADFQDRPLTGLINRFLRVVPPALVKELMKRPDYQGHQLPESATRTFRQLSSSMAHGILLTVPSPGNPPVEEKIHTELATLQEIFSESLGILSQEWMDRQYVIPRSIGSDWIPIPRPSGVTYASEIAGTRIMAEYSARLTLQFGFLFGNLTPDILLETLANFKATVVSSRQAFESTKLWGALERESVFFAFEHPTTAQEFRGVTKVALGAPSPNALWDFPLLSLTGELDRIHHRYCRTEKPTSSAMQGLAAEIHLQVNEITQGMGLGENFFPLNSR